MFPMQKALKSTKIKHLTINTKPRTNSLLYIKKYYIKKNPPFNSGLN